MHSFYLPPGNLDLIAVSGPDTVKLLQGQLTCDVAALPDPGFTRGALCNNKGRVLATFLLVKQGSTCYLALNKGLGAILTLALKKYLPFYKCELRQLPAEDHACFGVSGQSASTLPGLASAPPPEEGQCSNLANGWICALSQTRQQYLVYDHSAAPMPDNVATGALADWLVGGMLTGLFPFLPEDAEKYTPQELHLDRHGYVSFTKGCYTGQEIVARMHYRGKLKKLLFLLDAPWADNTPPTGSMEILDASGAILGTTLKALLHDGTLYALVALPADVEQTLPTRVKSANGLLFNVRVF
jgi:folate-binding protein YgfZ